jgi:hypothetical protein
MAAPVLVDLGRVHCLKAIEPEMAGQGFGVRIGCRYPPYLTATNGRLFEPVVNWIKRTEGEGPLECSLPGGLHGRCKLSVSGSGHGWSAFSLN